MSKEPISDPNPVGFRQATFHDMPHVWRIVYHAYSSYIPLLGRTPPTFLEDFDSHVESGNLWLCDMNGIISAMVVLTPKLDHMLIQAMCVDPQYQGQGFGRDLLAFSETRTRILGFPEMRLYTNSRMSRNIRIYRKWGFRQTHVESYGWGDRIHMRKSLAKRAVRLRKANAVLELA